MTDKVKMNYDTMDAMVKEFNAAHEQLEQTKSAVQKMGSQLEGGGLQGQAGNAFRDVINRDAMKALNRLIEVMAQEAKDVNGALVAMRDGVKTAQSRFK